MNEKKKFCEEQIIAVLREQEGGMKAADVCRKLGRGFGMRVTGPSRRGVKATGV